MEKESESKKKDDIELKNNVGVSSKGPEFGAVINSNLNPTENKSILSVIEQFCMTFSEQFSAYLGKKIEVEFSSIDCIEPNLKTDNINDYILSTFSIENVAGLGLVLFDNQLLDITIDSLFGAERTGEKRSEYTFGKCSLNIAQEIVTKALNIIQKAISEYTECSISLIKTSIHLKDIAYQNVSERVFQFGFKIKGKNGSQHFICLLPELVVEHIIYHNQELTNQSTEEKNILINNQLKNDVIDTTINLIAVLPDIKLKFNDVMNLKSGDLIPIPDPNEVELRVGNKKLYKALVGQSNSYRVVKTLESNNKS